MCTFITAVLPGDADPARWLPVMKQHGQGLSPQPNRSIEKQLAPGEQYFAFDGHCHCGTPLGGRGASPERRLERDVAELRRKKWSQTKIDRWLAEKAKVHAREELKHAVYSGGELGHWCDLLTAMHHEAGVRYTGLLVREYSGGLDGRIELKRREHISLAALDIALLADLEPDVLYLFG